MCPMEELTCKCSECSELISTVRDYLESFHSRPLNDPLTLMDGIINLIDCPYTKSCACIKSSLSKKEQEDSVSSTTSLDGYPVTSPERYTKPQRSQKKKLSRKRVTKAKVSRKRVTSTLSSTQNPEESSNSNRSSRSNSQKKRVKQSLDVLALLGKSYTRINSRKSLYSNMDNTGAYSMESNAQHYPESSSLNYSESSLNYPASSSSSNPRRRTKSEGMEKQKRIVGQRDSWQPVHDQISKIEASESLTDCFLCNICSTSFRLHAQAARHIRIVHLNQRKVCSDCGRGFYDGRNLRNHMMVCKGPEAGEPTTRKATGGKKKREGRQEKQSRHRPRNTN